ncbi:MAG: hypothetical protein K6G40_06770 [Eubacterium sp.]|nr:hypothetical protein [Eubacterium sp.]
MKRFLCLAMSMVTALCLTLTGCGSVSDDTTVATLGDTNIPYGVANFYVQYMQSLYDSYYLDYYGDSMWSSDLTGEGSTMEEECRADFLENIESFYRMDAHAEEYGVTLSDEELEAIDAAAEQFMEDNSETAIKQMGATKEIVAEYLRLATIESYMFDAIYAACDTEITDEEAACRTFTYIELSLEGETDESGDVTELTDEQIENLKEEAEAIIAGTGTNDLETMADIYGAETATYSYNEGDDGMDEAVLAAADELSEGEVYETYVETDTALYIIRLDSEYDEEASADKKTELQDEADQAYYEEVYAAWQEEVEFNVVEKVWKKISFAHLYTYISSDESGDASGDSSGDTE